MNTIDMLYASPWMYQKCENPKTADRWGKEIEPECLVNYKYQLTNNQY